MKNDDTELMLRFKEGDISCFEELMKRYETRILNFIYRFVGVRSEAEDLTQEVFLKVYQAKDKYEPKTEFSSWLYKITVNLCIDYQRKRKNPNSITFIETKDKNSDMIFQQIPDPQPPLDVSIEKAQISQVIKSCLLSLPAKQRIALELRVYENKSYKEISKILNCSVSAVESLLFRARQSLKQKLEKIIKI